MAKSKSFFGLRKGSTKSHTYSVLDGQQVTKDRVYDVKNPRTQGQMRQRMVMTTVGAAYKYLKAIADHSFEGRSSGMQCMRAFNSANLNRFKAGAALNGNVAYNEYKDGEINPLPFKLSEGSLSGIAYAFGADGRLAITFAKANADLSTAEGVYELMGVQKDDLITFCTVVGQHSIKNGVYDYKPKSFDIVRLRCDKSGAITDVMQAFTVTSNSATAQVTFATVANGFEVKSLLADFGAVIQSRKSNENWLRSTTYMVVKDGVVDGVLTQNQLSTYPIGNDLVLNNGHMANGDAVSDSPSPGALVISPAAWTASVDKGSNATQKFTFANDAGDNVTVNVGSTGITSAVAADKKSVTLTASNVQSEIKGSVTIAVGSNTASIPVTIGVAYDPAVGGDLDM